MTRTDSPTIVDAHQHFWDLELGKHPWLCQEPQIPFRYGDYSAIKKSYLPEQYRQDAAGQNVAATVYVETEWDPEDPIGELRWVEKIAEKYGVPNAMVAQAWMDREDIEHLLAIYAAAPLVKGVRHKPRTKKRPDRGTSDLSGSMSDPQWRKGFALLEANGLSFDLQIPYWHLEEASDLAKAFPSTRIILNHTGLPSDRSPKGLEAWRRGMILLSAHDNVALKISGLGLPGRHWSIEDNGPLIREAIEIFGVDRCMFASNYPVDGLVGGFDTIYDGYRKAVAHFSQNQKNALFRDNAMRFYRITAVSKPPALPTVMDIGCAF